MEPEIKQGTCILHPEHGYPIVLGDDEKVYYLDGSAIDDWEQDTRVSFVVEKRHAFVSDLEKL